MTTREVLNLFAKIEIDILRIVFIPFKFLKGGAELDFSGDSP